MPVEGLCTIGGSGTASFAVSGGGVGAAGLVDIDLTSRFATASGKATPNPKTPYWDAVSWRAFWNNSSCLTI